jgi:hypothetical protein
MYSKISQKPALVAEEDAEHFGDGEDDLAVGDIQKECLPHPLTPFLPPFRVTGGAKSSGAAREHQQAIFPTQRTADAGKPTAGVAAVKIALNHPLDDGPEETVLLLETGLIFLKEPVKVMEKHPVEHGALRMTGAVHSCHSGKMASRNGPALQI